VTDFPRNAKTGAPQVAHPTRTTSVNGTKPELIQKCVEAGIRVPVGAKIADLLQLLGPRPVMVTYGRPSSLGKQIENQTNLQKWAERMVACGIAVDPILQRDCLALAVPREQRDTRDWREAADAVAVKAKSAAQADLAADRGTHAHALTEDHDQERDWIERARTGEDLGLPHPVQAALVAAWEKMLMTHGIEILATEAQVVDDLWRQAGTLDRVCRLTRDLRFLLPTGEIVTLPAGWVGILDIKSGKLRLDQQGHVGYWHGYAVQLASYAQARPYDPETLKRSDWPFEIDQKWAVIAHLDVLAALEGTAVCRLILVDLAAGRAAGELCVAAREWEKRTDVFSVPDAELAVEVAVGTTDPFDEPF
jgi:hypothetical protein